MIRLSEIINEQDPCWKGYKQVGMKDKDGREVPNCVPESVNEEQINELSADTYKNTVKAALQRGDSKGNSIAVKALQLFGKEIAKELAGKSFEVKGSMKDVTKALYKGSSYSYINQVKMTFTGEGSLFHDNNVKVFGSDEAHFNMKVVFQLPDNIGGFSSDVKFRGYQSNKIPAIVQFSIKGGKVWIWFKGADTDLEFTRVGAREMAKLADTIVTAMDFPTKAKHNTIKQFDAMKPTTESVNEESYKVAGRPVTLIKGKKANGTDWKVRFQNGKETALSDVLSLIKPFPKLVKEATTSDVIKDLDKAKNDLLKKVDALIAKKKKLYSDVDIEAPMSADEKKLDKDIADLFSQINKLVLQKRSVKKESVNEAYIPSNIKEFAKRKGVTQLVNTVAGWAEKVAKGIKGGTAIGKNYNTLILDMSYNGSEIRINCEDETIELYDEPVRNFQQFKKVYNEYQMDESVNEASNDYSPLAYAKLVAKGKISMEKAIKETGYPFIILAKLVRAYDRNYKFEGVMNEGHFGEIDIMAQNASNFREFVKDFYKEYKDFPKDRDTMKWLESLYKSRANEGLDSQGLERVAAGLPQTEEEPIEEGVFKIGVKHIIPLIPTGYAPNDPKYKGDLRYLRNMLNNFYKERGYEKVILPSF